MKSIISITWNWSPATMEGHNDNMTSYSETFEEVKLTDVGVKQITHVGNSVFDIHKTDDTILRIFNPNTLIYK